jgi:hypothetical protein
VASIRLAAAAVIARSWEVAIPVRSPPGRS